MSSVMDKLLKSRQDLLLRIKESLALKMKPGSNINTEKMKTELYKLLKKAQKYKSNYMKRLAQSKRHEIELVKKREMSGARLPAVDEENKLNSSVRKNKAAENSEKIEFESANISQSSFEAMSRNRFDSSGKQNKLNKDVSVSNFGIGAPSVSTFKSKIPSKIPFKILTFFSSRNNQGPSIAKKTQQNEH